jgi:hypothetical protein
MRKNRDARGKAMRRVQVQIQNLTIKWARDRMTAEERDAIRIEAYRRAGVEMRPRGRPVAGPFRKDKP